MVRVILDRCDDTENTENVSAQNVPAVLIDSESELDKSCEFVCETSASSESKQIARLNQKIDKLQRALDVKNDAKSDKKVEAHTPMATSNQTSDNQQCIQPMRGQSPLNEIENNQLDGTAVGVNRNLDLANQEAGPSHQPKENTSIDLVDNEAEPSQQQNGNDSFSFSDSFIERTADEWAGQPRTIDDFIKFLEN